MKEIITSSGAPAAIGPYSHAVKIGNLLYASGQIPLVPETGKLAGKDIETQVYQVFANIKAVLAANSMDLSSVVKTTVYMVDLADFVRLNNIYATYFPNDPPARSCVQVAALPQGALVEIEVVAAK